MSHALAPAVTLEAQERRFAFALLAPALAALLLTTTVPLVYLAWNSLHRLDLGMPWLSGFAGLDNYAKMGSDPRFWNSLLLTGIYTASTVVLQVVVGLALALLVLQIPRGQGVLRVAAILPIVLAPVVVGLFWRTLVLAPDVGLVDMVTRALGLGSHNWLGDPQLALISVIAIHTWQWTPFAFLVILATLATLPPAPSTISRMAAPLVSSRSPRLPVISACRGPARPALARSGVSGLARRVIMPRGPNSRMVANPS